jgi:hypothetical protein
MAVNFDTDNPNLRIKPVDRDSFQDQLKNYSEDGTQTIWLPLLCNNTKDLIIPSATGS